MPSFCRVLIIGNTTRDPTSKVLPSNTTVTEFGLAINRKFRTQAGEDREEVVFVDCAAYGKAGETIAKYVTKGKPLFVEGRLKQDVWDDRNGGGKRSKLTVVVENFQFLGSREQGEPATRGSGTGAPAQQEDRGDSPFAGSPGGEFKEDDIPFTCPAAL